MIHDHIRNLEQYKGDAKLYAALSAIKQFVNNEPYEKDSVVSLSKAECTPIPLAEARLENHQQRTDIHYVISGEERILVNNNTNLKRLTEYSQEKDCELFSLSGEEIVVDLHEGEFLVVYPGESHAPKCAINNEMVKIVKVVVKL